MTCCHTVDESFFILDTVKAANCQLRLQYRKCTYNEYISSGVH